MKKLKVLSMLVVLVFGVVFTGCEKDTSTNDYLNQPDSQQETIDQYQYQKSITVTDQSQQYYIVVNLQANSLSLLEDAISAKPYITVSSEFKDIASSELEHVEEGAVNISSVDVVVYQMTSDRNIPEGMAYIFHLSDEPSQDQTKSGCGVPGDPISRATFQDNLATKVYTMNSTSCSIKCIYYSRGSKSWSSIFWYNRGYRHLEDYESYTFNANNYTTYSGIKVKAERYFNLYGLTWYVVN